MAWVNWQRPRQDPQLGRDRVASLPCVEVENREPVLAPRRNGAGAAVPVDPGVRAAKVGIIGADAQKAQRDVVEHRGEEISLAVEMQPKTALAGLCAAQRRDKRR